MVGDRQSRHAELLCPCEKVTDGRLAVKDGILRVDMKMDE
jgi:hypothetical protein